MRSRKDAQTNLMGKGMNTHIIQQIIFRVKLNLDYHHKIVMKETQSNKLKRISKNCIKIN